MNNEDKMCNGCETCDQCIEPGKHTAMVNNPLFKLNHTDATAFVAECQTHEAAVKFTFLYQLEV